MAHRPQPFFSISQEGTPARGRLLLISYHFPPGGSAGALRWQRLTQHAANEGWALDVITLNPADLRGPDYDRLEELPPGTRVFGVPGGKMVIDRVEQAIWNWGTRFLSALRMKPSRDSSHDGASTEARVQSLGRDEILGLSWTPRVFVRSYYTVLLIRRERIWARRAARVAARILAGGRHEAVISCGPPHPCHLAGAQVARRSGLPHVVDMRDPWSLAERAPEVIATPLLYRTARRLESTVVPKASLVVCNTQPACDALVREYPEIGERCIAVMNGYDREVMPKVSRGRRFLLAYAGSIYLDRDPRGLFRAAARIVSQRKLTPDDFGIEFMGDARSYNGLALEAIAAQEGLAGFVKVHPGRPRAEAMQFLAGAAMLVSLPQDSHMAIPSKVFEYMRFDAWLLALADEGSATHQLLSGSGADVVAPDNEQRMVAIIGERFDEYRSSGAPNQPALIPGCARAEQARILFDALHVMLAKERPRIRVNRPGFAGDSNA